jgi:hypothetical protein
MSSTGLVVRTHERLYGLGFKSEFLAAHAP